MLLIFARPNTQRKKYACDNHEDISLFSQLLVRSECRQFSDVSTRNWSTTSKSVGFSVGRENRWSWSSAFVSSRSWIRDHLRFDQTNDLRLECQKKKITFPTRRSTWSNRFINSNLSTPNMYSDRYAAQFKPFAKSHLSKWWSFYSLSHRSSSLIFKKVLRFF